MQAYPDLRANLRRAGAPNDVAGSRLVAGIVIQELVFEGAKVDLGQDTDAEFALTLWYSQNHEKSSEPLTAEISFKYDTDDGRGNEAVAQRALKHFKRCKKALAHGQVRSTPRRVRLRCPPVNNHKGPLWVRPSTPDSAFQACIDQFEIEDGNRLRNSCPQLTNNKVHNVLYSIA